MKDVITQLEPGLFKKVTGLDVKDFELLVSLGVFNDSLMNDAVYKFKRYEDASLSYTGIDRHEGENRGGWDTVISDADYNSMFALQQASMEAPIPSADDLPENRFWILRKLSGIWISPKRKSSIHRRLQKDRLCMGGTWKSHAILHQRQNRQNLHHTSRWICPVLWLAVSFGIKHLVWGM